MGRASGETEDLGLPVLGPWKEFRDEYESGVKLDGYHITFKHTQHVKMITFAENKLLLNADETSLDASDSRATSVDLQTRRYPSNVSMGTCDSPFSWPLHACAHSLLSLGWYHIDTHARPTESPDMHKPRASAAMRSGR